MKENNSRYIGEKHIWAAIEKVERARSLDELHSALHDYAAEHGFSSTSIVPLINPAATQINYFEVGRSNWPDEFQKRWVEQRYIFNDPITHYALRRRASFSWSDIYEQADKIGQRILDEGRDFGLNEGLAIPVMSESYPIGIVSFGAERVDISPRDRACIELLAIHAYARLLKLAELPQIYDDNPLTERERELLHYVAAGKTNIEIGIILGIQADTVKKHLDSIRAKQNAVNRAHSVAKGYQNGILLY